MYFQYGCLFNQIKQVGKKEEIPIKTLIIGDLHLMYREMKSTKGALENNRIMLQSIYNKVEEDSEIGLVIFLGDIQHSTPRDIKQVSEWRRWFVDLNRLMIDRNQTKVNLRYPAEKKHKNDLRVLSLRGNHDDEIFSRRKSDYTFFDELESEGLIGNPDQAIFEDNGNAVVFDIRNYGHAGRLLPEDLQDKALTVALTHDNIMTEESDEVVKLIVQESGGYEVEEIGVGCDIVINGHIHTKYEPQAVTIRETGKPCIFMVNGSLARTSLAQDNLRDVGYGMLIDTKEEEVDVQEVEFPVMPYREYFDLKGYQHKQRLNQASKDFSLGLDEQTVINQEDLEQTIRESRQYSNQVIEKALEYLELVDNDLERLAREE